MKCSDYSLFVIHHNGGAPDKDCARTKHAVQCKLEKVNFKQKDV